MLHLIWKCSATPAPHAALDFNTLTNKSGQTTSNLLQSDFFSIYFFYMTWLVKLQFEWQYWISCSIFSACIHLLNIYRPHILVNHLKRHESDVIMYIPKQWKWPFIMGNQGDRFWNEISMFNILLKNVYNWNSSKNLALHAVRFLQEFYPNQL